MLVMQTQTVVNDDVLDLPVTTESLPYIKVTLNEQITHLVAMLDLYKTQRDEAVAKNGFYAGAFNDYIKAREVYIAEDGLKLDILKAYYAAL